MSIKKWLIAICFAVVVGAVIFLHNSRESLPREPGRRATCINNMSQIALTLLTYEAIHGHFPPPYTVDENGKPLHSWRTLLLPYFERRDLYEKIRLNEPWDSEYNKQFHDEPMPVFICPSKGAYGEPRSDYDVVVGDNTVFPPWNGKEQPKVSSSDLAGWAGNTIFLIERKTTVHWMQPGGVSIDDLDKELDWRHGNTSITVVAMADRNIQTIDKKIGIDAIKRLCQWKNRTHKEPQVKAYSP